MPPEATSPLPESVRSSLLARSQRLQRALRRISAILAAVSGGALLFSFVRTSLLAGEGVEGPDLAAGLLFAAWQGGGAVLLVLGMGFLHGARTRSLVEDARPVFGLPGAGHGPLGTGIVPGRTASPALDLGGVLLLSATRSVSGWLPSMVGAWFLPWEGKTRCEQVGSFGDEEPIPTDDGRGLFLVSPGAWYYPPSPCLLRAVSGDPAAEDLRAFVREMEALDAASLPLPSFIGPGDAPARTRRAARLAAAGLAGVAVLFFLPVFLAFGWLSVALMAFAAGGMLAVGGIARAHDWEKDVRKWREGGGTGMR